MYVSSHALSPWKQQGLDWNGSVVPPLLLSLSYQIKYSSVHQPALILTYIKYYLGKFSRLFPLKKIEKHSEDKKILRWSTE